MASFVAGCPPRLGWRWAGCTACRFDRVVAAITFGRGVRPVHQAGSVQRRLLLYRITVFMRREWNVRGLKDSMGHSPTNPKLQAVADCIAFAASRRARPGFGHPVARCRRMSPVLGFTHAKRPPPIA